MSNRTPLIAGNWKMHGTLSEALQLADALEDELSGITDREIMIAPPFPVLHAVAERLDETSIRIGAQNMHWEAKGAFTGEVSAPMLLEVGCTHVILGHSERRQYFGETDEQVAKKVRSALQHGLLPILCVGETLQERERNETFEVVKRQVHAALSGLGEAELRKVVIAYEPVWAIGTGKVATPQQAQEVHAFVRGLLEALAGKSVAEGIRILYGGSVKPDNIDALMNESDVDGALVGGASLQAKDFTRIVRFA